MYMGYTEIVKFYLVVRQWKELRNPFVDYVVERNGKTICAIKG